MESKSQVGQDVWALQMLKNKRNGFFLDIGALDGIYLSNTYMLEKEFGWTGIAIEADPSTYNNMINIRNCICVNKAITNFNGKCYFQQNRESGMIASSGIEVEAITLSELFKLFNVPKIIDYISLDIEGGEYNALLGFPFNEYHFLTLTVEHNLYVSPENAKHKENIFNILTSNNYIRFKENVDHLGYIFEDWYVHSLLINLL